MRRFALPCACGLSLALVGACSGAAPQAFPLSRGTSSGGSSSGYSGSGSSGGSSSSSGGSGGNGSGSSGGHASGSSGSYDGGDEAGLGDDGGADASDSSTGDGPASQGILCKAGNQSSYCQRNQLCCITAGVLTGSTATCQSSQNSCSGTAVHCAGTADCPGSQVCCATGTLSAFGATTYTEFGCVATCPAATGLTTMVRYQVCDMAASDCPTGKTCMASTSLTGYSVCR